MPATANLAFLGLGQMGAPIARLLLTQGHNVTLWNRDRRKADTIQSGNARIAASPQDAVANATIAFTMLADDAATEAVLFGNPESAGDRPGFRPGFLDALPQGAVHVTLSTISVALARRITAAHQERGQHREHDERPPPHRLRGTEGDHDADHERRSNSDNLHGGLLYAANESPRANAVSHNGPATSKIRESGGARKNSATSRS